MSTRKLATCLAVIIAPFAAGCSNLHTKLGGPAGYFGHEASSGRLYVAACLALCTAACLMFFTLPCREGGCLGSVIFLLIAAGVLLQCMPPANCGFQLIPLSPWAYQGWIAFFISCLSWFLLGIAALVACSEIASGGGSDGPSVFAHLCLSAMALQLVLSFCGISDRSENSETPKAARTEPETGDIEMYRGQAEEWEASQRQSRATLEALAADRERARQRLRAAPADSRESARSTTEKELLKNEINELDTQIAQLRTAIAAADTNLAAIHSSVRRLERREKVAKLKQDTQTQLDELRTRRLELEERLRRSDD